jgi:hypothetical protein
VAYQVAIEQQRQEFNAGWRRLALVAWRRRPAQPSILAHWLSTSMTRPKKQILARGRDEDFEPEQGSAKEPGESAKGRREAVEELSSPAK